MYVSVRGDESEFESECVTGATFALAMTPLDWMPRMTGCTSSNPR